MNDYKHITCIDYKYLNEQLEKAKPRSILLELPRWLKHETIRLLEEIRLYTSEIYIEGNDIWGACYLNVDLARKMNIDCIVHVGHGKFKNSTYNTILVPFRFENASTIDNLLQQLIPSFRNMKRIHLEFSIEFIHLVDHICSTFKKYGIETSYLKGKEGVTPCLGCRYDHLFTLGNKVDAIVYIADEFHAHGSIEATTLPVYCVEPYQDKIIHYPSSYGEAFHQERKQLYEGLAKCNRIGILVESHFAQMQIKRAKWYCTEFHKLGKQAEILIFSEMSSSKILFFDCFDIFINTSCPRLAHYNNYPGVPMLTEREAIHFILNKGYPQKTINSFPTRIHFKPQQHYIKNKLKE